MSGKGGETAARKASDETRHFAGVKKTNLKQAKLGTKQAKETRLHEMISEIVGDLKEKEIMLADSATKFEAIRKMKDRIAFVVQGKSGTTMAMVLNGLTVPELLQIGDAMNAVTHNDTLEKFAAGVEVMFSAEFEALITSRLPILSWRRR